MGFKETPPLPASDLPTGDVKSTAEAVDRARSLLSEALAQLDLIDADIALRARLQGVIDDLDGPSAGEIAPV